MKSIIVCVLVLFVAFTSEGQAKRKGADAKERKGAEAKERKANGNTIDASEVPDAVKNAFSATGATATRWEKHQAKGKSAKSFAKYVAIYTQDGMRVRARFREDGTALSTSKYMKADQLPAAIRSAAEAKVAGQKVVGGEEVKTKKGDTFYRVASKGGGSRTVSVFDAAGKPITKEKISDDLKESDGEDEGDDN